MLLEGMNSPVHLCILYNFAGCLAYTTHNSAIICGTEQCWLMDLFSFLLLFTLVTWMYIYCIEFSSRELISVEYFGVPSIFIMLPISSPSTAKKQLFHFSTQPWVGSEPQFFHHRWFQSQRVLVRVNCDRELI